MNKFGNYLTPGIRSQLLDRKEMKLVMDYVIEQGENSTHVLNAVSPAGSHRPFHLVNLSLIK